MVTQRGKLTTSVISFSLDLDTLLYLDAYRVMKGGISMSQAIRYHIKMGRIYIKMLDEDSTSIEGIEEEYKDE